MDKAKRPLSIKFPLGGLDRSVAYQDQPPQTTPSALNVRPEETLEGRARGGSRPGLSKAFAEDVGGEIKLLLSCEIPDLVEGTPTRSLLLAADGQVYASLDGELVGIGGPMLDETGAEILDEAGDVIESDAASVSGEVMLSATQRGRYVVIADYGPDKVSGSDGSVSGGILTAASVTNWVAEGVDADSDVAVLVNTSGVTTGTYAISLVSPSGLTLVGSPGTGTCTFEIVRAPKIFDPVERTLTKLVATTGQAPSNSPIVCTFRDRIVFCKERIWYMSRQGDHLDYNYGDDAADAGRAVAGTNAEAGQVGQLIVAAAPHGDDYLVFFGEDSIYVLRGDPAYGGQIDNLSRLIGIVGRFAWCYGPEGQLIFLARDGLYMIPYGAQARPEPLSRDRLPQELQDIDRDTHHVSMSYDIQDRGVHIFITPVAGTAGSHWWFDWETKSFWPVLFGTNTMQPTLCTLFAETAGDERQVVLASLDGYIRKVDYTASTDDGTAINSSVLFGPFRLAGDDERVGIVTDLVATLDTSSGSVTVSLFTGDYAEQAVFNAAGTAKWSKTHAAGRSFKSYPRVRGGALVVAISATTRWAMELISLMVAPGGRQRRS